MYWGGCVQAWRAASPGGSLGPSGELLLLGAGRQRGWKDTYRNAELTYSIAMRESQEKRLFEQMVGWKDLRNCFSFMCSSI